ncbi:MAG: SMC-Scp complex subunit ScpB [Erysipelothrix sp.]|nr:SMC-Scp complex subunit ScpB [Erysipelothrix sp.]
MEDKLIQILEGIIFVNGDEGIDSDSLVNLLEVDRQKVYDALEALRLRYQDEAYGIELVHYGGMFKFVSKESVYPYIQKLFQVTKKNTLSPAALETLAIIAYKQPITRVEIEEIRGVGSDAMLRRLSLRNLIEEVGRADSPGMPILYGVTSEFLDIFKLLSIDELPDLPNYDGQMEMDLYE